ncbi:MAG: hypothetical protein PHE67_05685 [Campylobacterales bacterium]|nr:hypothetical protein [Campylobacterales bacterium]
MLAITIDNPQVESYFSNSAEKLKEFLERFVKDDTSYTSENEKQYKTAIKELDDKETLSSKEARSVLGI